MATTPGGYIPYDAPLPGGATPQQAALLANTAYQKALSALNLRRQSTLRQYGYAGTVDANTGNVTDVRVDPYNPYGSFQTLLHNSATSMAQARNAAEGRGLHGGLAHQLTREAQYQHGSESQALGTALTDTLTGYQTEQEQANEARNQALYQAQLDAARNAIGNDPNVAGPTSSGGGDSGGGGNTTDSSSAGTTPTRDPFADWLLSQSAAAGMYRTNKPRGVRGVYVE